MKYTLALSALTIAVLYVNPAFALSADAEAGKSVFAACDVCHDAEKDPPLGPPFFQVQRQYKRQTPDKEAFIDAMVDFVKAPTEGKVRMRNAAKELGVMPAMALPDSMLKNLASYIYEEEFAPPCKHWTIAIAKSLKTGDEHHAKQEQRMVDAFCK